MTEEWRDITGYKGFYQVSSYGRVRSLDRTIINRDGIRRHYKGRELIVSVTNSNFEQVRLCRAGKIESMCVHILVLNAFKSKKADEVEGKHIDGDTLNNKIENLKWARGKNRGENSGRHVLTEIQVKKIRERYAAGDITQLELGKIYGVNYSTIGHIVRRQTWTDI